MSAAEMLGMLTQMGLRPGQDLEAPPPRQPDATAMELRVRLAHWDMRHQFQRGDLVIFKRGFETRNGDAAGQPMMVMACPWLPPGDFRAPPIDTARSLAVLHDTVVMHLAPDGTALFHWTCSARLEPWPRPDPMPAQDAAA